MDEDSRPSNPEIVAASNSENTCYVCKQWLTDTSHEHRFCKCHQLVKPAKHSVNDSGASTKEEHKGDLGNFKLFTQSLSANSDHHTLFKVKLAEIESIQRDLEQLAVEFSTKLKLQGAALCALRQNALSVTHESTQNQPYHQNGALPTTNHPDRSTVNCETFPSLKAHLCLVDEVEPQLDTSCALTQADQDVAVPQQEMVVGVNLLGLPTDHFAAVAHHL